ncbi:hypothetical protein BCR42DRAFT_429156 [Absidia repens]|uniref:Uncharacterized protein n=1 Tax=Absidia repens TaxID=90262 RepID=A0A1X2HXI9_9FUNG|nr:hypothetical protein BCR42DRAFT_429156 [Absidia repens]
MVKASSFTLLFAFSAVMIEGAPLTARSKEHRTKDNAPADESKLQSNINGGQFAPDLPGSNPNLNYDQQGPGVRSGFY